MVIIIEFLSHSNSEIESYIMVELSIYLIILWENKLPGNVNIFFLTFSEFHWAHKMWNFLVDSKQQWEMPPGDLFLVAKVASK